MCETLPLKQLHPECLLDELDRTQLTTSPSFEFEKLHSILEILASDQETST
jgi:hypothetical protein